MVIDLHVHSTYSDGCLSPGQLVERAQQLGIRAIALTDHDTVAGIPELLARGEQLGISVLPGVELSCEGYHILGYGVDCNYGPLLRQLQELANARQQRAERIVARLASIGIELELERIRELAGVGVIGRPHVAAALVEQGLAADVADAFSRYLSKGRPGYVPRYRLEPQQAIELIRSAGGIPVWAHPGKDFSRERLLQLKSWGLLGVEVWHPDHDREEMLWFADQAARADLLVTGGSDFHCPPPGSAELGSFPTPEWAWVALNHKMT
ncbi:MAG: PHP domain-containing protein [Firmicutes bacterium]|nr:PHP domain-containing protein [Bacillota bacterium]